MYVKINWDKSWFMWMYRYEENNCLKLMGVLCPHACQALLKLADTHSPHKESLEVPGTVGQRGLCFCTPWVWNNRRDSSWPAPTPKYTAQTVDWNILSLKRPTFLSWSFISLRVSFQVCLTSRSRGSALCWEYRLRDAIFGVSLGLAAVHCYLSERNPYSHT